ncbi:MAG: hypothetical protein JO108_24515 [Acidobacteriaceae bacterium]|nr:hypothetical protein [Acidobacteriaceae bacterium]
MRLDDGASSGHEKAYSVDLSEKIAPAAAVGRGMSKRPRLLSHVLGVGATSLKRYVVKLKEQGKPLTPGKAPAKKKAKKLDGNAM